jgi:hypothetical protein
MSRFPIAVAMAATLFASAAGAQTLVLRSDLPLWPDGRTEVWPQSFSNDDGFGCASLFEIGDWRLGGATPDGADDWVRIGHYGAFHCANTYATARNRLGLGNAGHDLTFLASLGVSGAEELFAVQIGLRGGSRYILLAATKPGPRERPKKFRVLDPDCPRSMVRRGGMIDLWITDYCVARNAGDIRRVAFRGAAKPSELFLEYAGPAASGD